MEKQDHNINLSTEELNAFKTNALNDWLDRFNNPNLNKTIRARVKQAAGVTGDNQRVDASSFPSLNVDSVITNSLLNPRLYLSKGTEIRVMNPDQGTETKFYLYRICYNYNIPADSKYAEFNREPPKSDDKNKQRRYKQNSVHLGLAYSPYPIRRLDRNSVIYPLVGSGTFYDSLTSRVITNSPLNHLRNSKPNDYWDEITNKIDKSAVHEVSRHFTAASNGMVNYIRNKILDQNDKPVYYELGIPGFIVYKVLSLCGWITGYLALNVSRGVHIEVQHMTQEIDMATLGLFNGALNGMDAANFFSNNLAFSKTIEGSNHWARAGQRYVELEKLDPQVSMIETEDGYGYVLKEIQIVLDRLLIPLTSQVTYTDVEKDPPSQAEKPQPRLAGRISTKEVFDAQGLRTPNPKKDRLRYVTCVETVIEKGKLEDLSNQLNTELEEHLEEEGLTEETLEMLAKGDLKSSDLNGDYGFTFEHPDHFVDVETKAANAQTTSSSVPQESTDDSKPQDNDNPKAKVRTKAKTKAKSERLETVTTPIRTPDSCFSPGALELKKAEGSTTQVNQETSKSTQSDQATDTNALTSGDVPSSDQTHSDQEDSLTIAQYIEKVRAGEPVDEKAFCEQAMIEIVAAHRNMIKLSKQDGRRTVKSLERLANEVVAKLLQAEQPERGRGRLNKATAKRSQALCNSILSFADYKTSPDAIDPKLHQLTRNPLANQHVEFLKNLHLHQKEFVNNKSSKRIILVDCSILPSRADGISTNRTTGQGSKKKGTYVKGSKLLNLVDLELNRTVFTRVFSSNISEHTFLQTVMKIVCKLGYQDAIFIFDRGYDNRSFKTTLEKLGLKYVMMSKAALKEETAILARTSAKVKQTKVSQYDPDQDAYLDVYSTTYDELGYTDEDGSLAGKTVNYITLYRPARGHHQLRRHYEAQVDKAITYTKGTKKPTKSEIETKLFVQVESEGETIWCLNTSVYDLLYKNDCQMLCTNIEFTNIQGIGETIVENLRYASAVVALYDMRWDIELFFRICKSTFKKTGVAVRLDASLGVKLGIALLISNIHRIMQRAHNMWLQLQNKHRDTHNTLHKILMRFLKDVRVSVSEDGEPEEVNEKLSSVAINMVAEMLKFDIGTTEVVEAYKSLNDQKWRTINRLP